MMQVTLRTDTKKIIHFLPGTKLHDYHQLLPGADLFQSFNSCGTFSQQEIACKDYWFYKWYIESTADTVLELEIAPDQVLLFLPLQNAVHFSQENQHYEAVPGVYNFIYCPQQSFSLHLEKQVQYNFMVIAYPILPFAENYLPNSAPLRHFMHRIRRQKPASLYPRCNWIPDNYMQLFQLDSQKVPPLLFPQYLTEMINLVTIGLLYTPAVQKREGHVADGRVRSVVAQVKAIIEKSLPTHIPISDLAQRVGVNRTQVNNWFKIITGQTIHQYYLSVKMKKAEEMLAAGKSIKEIARKYYHNHPSRFISLYREKHGYPPGTLRKKAG